VFAVMLLVTVFAVMWLVTYCVCGYAVSH